MHVFSGLCTDKRTEAPGGPGSSGDNVNTCIDHDADGEKVMVQPDSFRGWRGGRQKQFEGRGTWSRRGPICKDHAGPTLNFLLKSEGFLSVP